MLHSSERVPVTEGLWFAAEKWRWDSVLYVEKGANEYECHQSARDVQFPLDFWRRCNRSQIHFLLCGDSYSHSCFFFFDIRCIEHFSSVYESDNFG